MMRKRIIMGIATMSLLASGCKAQTQTSDHPPKVPPSKTSLPKAPPPETKSKIPEYVRPWEDKALIQGFETCYAENGAEKALKLCDFNHICQNIGGFDKFTMSYCIQTTQQLWESKLTEVYDALMIHMKRSDEVTGVAKGSKVEALRKSQLAWEENREASCNDLRKIYQGGEQGLHVASCKQEMTRQRTVALNKDSQYLDRR